MLQAVPAGVYPSLCTVQVGSGAQDAYGHEETVWGDLVGHVGIACRIAPRGASERAQAEQIYAETTHIVSLAGYYPGILPTMQAVVDGFAYGIEGVEHDGNRVTTRLYVRSVA
jgi:hypothetical protein